MNLSNSILNIINNLFVSRCSINCVCTNLSNILPGRGVSAMGLKSPTSLGIETFGIGTIVACLHIIGKYPWNKDLFIITSNFSFTILKHNFKTYADRC